MGHWSAFVAHFFKLNFYLVTKFGYCHTFLSLLHKIGLESIESLEIEVLKSQSLETENLSRLWNPWWYVVSPSFWCIFLEKYVN